MWRASIIITAVALVAAACGSDVAEITTVPATDSTSTPTSVTTTTFVEPTPEGSTTTIVDPVTPTSTTPGLIVLEVVVAEGEIAELRVTLNDEVRLIVYSEEADEVHLHTYDIAAEVAPGAPGVIEFVASIPGIFEVEFERAGTLIAELRVDP